MNGMNNTQIICNELVNRKIYTEDELIEMLENGIMPPVHTYNQWKKFGYQVKKGEKATITTRLWNYNPKWNVPKSDDDTDEDMERRKFYLDRSYLFLESQVEAIDKATQTA